MEKTQRDQGRQKREEQGFLSDPPQPLGVLIGSSLLLMHCNTHVKQPVCHACPQVCSKMFRFVTWIHIKQTNSGFMSIFVNTKCNDPQVGELNLRC